MQYVYEPGGIIIRGFAVINFAVVDGVSGGWFSPKMTYESPVALQPTKAHGDLDDELNILVSKICQCCIFLRTGN